MHIVTLDPKQHADERRKADLLSVIDEMRKSAEDGTLKEFVACSLGEDGECKLHVFTMDFPGSVGLFEIGKNMLMNIDQLEDE